MDFETIRLGENDGALLNRALLAFRPLEVASMEACEKLLAREDHVYFVALDPGKNVLGWVVAYEIQRFKKKEMFLFEIDVIASARRRGIARALVKALKRHSKQSGVDEMFVMTDYRNKAALSLYTNTGAKPTVLDSILFTYQIR